MHRETSAGEENMLIVNFRMFRENSKRQFKF